MAYADTDVNSAAAGPQCDETAPLVGDPEVACGGAAIDLAAAELPAFLTEDEPGVVVLDGVLAP